jgi:hypothetical protein
LKGDEGFVRKEGRKGGREGGKKVEIARES